MTWRLNSYSPKPWHLGPSLSIRRLLERGWAISLRGRICGGLLLVLSLLLVGILLFLYQYLARMRRVSWERETLTLFWITTRAELLNRHTLSPFPSQSKIVSNTRR